MLRPYVLHVSPVMFGPDGYWGGGERYALELARAHSRLVPTRLLSFGTKRRRLRLGDLSIHVLPVRLTYRENALNSISEWLIPEIACAKLVHVHQVYSALTDVVLLIGRALGKPIFVTDLGGAAPMFGHHFHAHDSIAAHLALSRFAVNTNTQLDCKSYVIYGGADLSRFKPGSGNRDNTVVYVGRVMPHKGIHDLVDAVPPEMPLEIHGRTYDPAYREALDGKALGKSVTFYDSSTDAEIIRAYQRARIAVLPSVYDSAFGGPYPKAELLGLTLIEAMACGTPAVASSAASLPEVVVDESSGLVFPEGDPSSLRSCLVRLQEDDVLWRRMSEAALTRVRTMFTWERTAVRALEAYVSA